MASWTGVGRCWRWWCCRIASVAVAAAAGAMVAPMASATQQPRHNPSPHPGAPVGVQLGYSSADFGGVDGNRLGRHEGALAGVYATAYLTTSFALQPELLFALKGGQTMVTGENVVSGGGATSVPVEIELAYFEVPILAKLTPLANRRRLHPIVFGGVAPAIRIGCALSATINDIVQQASCDSLPALPFKALDFGIVMGGGVEFDWSQTALAFQVRYTLGLPSVLGSLADLRNRQWGIMLALNF